MRAAVPDYLGNRFDLCPPGHRFSLYFPVWENDWTLAKTRKSAALGQILKLNGHVAMLDALRERQEHLLATVPENERMSTHAISTAPFATGMGMEHPLENGFAFLNPYGLPYLPASGVKGVLRRAAEELALFEAGDATLLDVWWLFGFEGAAGAVWVDQQWRDAFENHINKILDRPDLVEFLDRLQVAKDKTDLTERFQSLRDRRRDLQSRGALTFWDALPSPKNGSLEMEVMTPHYGDYYQHQGTPHDSGLPNPIVFLAVPAGSSFSFHIHCDTRLLPAGLQDNWQGLMRTAFRHAFDWLGFGAKTAVGYGAMKRDLDAEEAARQRAAKEAALRKAEEETRRRQAEFDALPESQKRLLSFREAIDAIGGTSPLNKDLFGRFKGEVTALVNEAIGWSPEDRSHAADAIEATFDQLGWTPSGLKPDKRKKMEKKHRQLIDELRKA